MIRPADTLGAVLVGRALAAALRERIEDAARQGDVVVDLQGVEMMSPSFADELFAKLPPELVKSGRIRFENVGEELEALVQFLRNGRIAPA